MFIVCSVGLVAYLYVITTGLRLNTYKANYIPFSPSYTFCFVLIS